MSDSRWVQGSGRKGTPKIPIKKERDMKCPKCGNNIECYNDNTVGRHKDYGKDPKTGKPKTKGPWAYCSYKKWR
jgi:hypothetical protein